MHLGKIMHWFDANNIRAKDATKEDCKRCLAYILDRNYKGSTKAAYAFTLQRFVHFAKTGEIGHKSEDSDYVEEVRWIRPGIYTSGHKTEIKPQDLLTENELLNSHGSF
jgi:site-specific recombinase XerD